MSPTGETRSRWGTAGGSGTQQISFIGVNRTGFASPPDPTAYAPPTGPLPREETAHWSDWVQLRDAFARALASIIRGSQLREVKPWKRLTFTELPGEVADWFREALLGLSRLLPEQYTPKVDRPVSFVILEQLLLTEPLEDGVSHPAEELLSQTSAAYPESTLTWLNRLLETRPALAAELLKCLGRIRPKQLEPRMYQQLRKALSHEDVEVRDAAVQVLEAWGGAKAAELLRERLHKEPVPWLAEYISGVLSDLER